MEKFNLGLLCEKDEPPEDDDLAWPFENSVFPRPAKQPSSGTFVWNPRCNGYLGKAGTWQIKSPQKLPGYAFHKDFAGPDGSVPAYIRSWHETFKDLETADPSNTTAEQPETALDEPAGLPKFSFGRRFKTVATMRETKFSLTVTIPASDVPVHFLEEIGVFMQTYAAKGIASLERGEGKNGRKGLEQLYVQCCFILCCNFPACHKDLVDCIKGHLTFEAKTRVTVLVKPFGVPQDWTFMVGDCRKEYGKEHFDYRCHNISEEDDLRAGERKHTEQSRGWHGHRFVSYRPS